MCFHSREVKVWGSWSQLWWERFHTVLFEHSHHNGLSYWYPPVCKLKEGLKLLWQLIAVQKLTKDPCLVTQDMWTLICYLPEGSHSIQKKTGWVKDGFCLGNKFSLEGRKKGLNYVYMNEAGYEDRIVWLPRRQDCVPGPPWGPNKPHKPTERPDKPSHGVVPKVPKDRSLPEYDGWSTRNRRNTKPLKLQGN